MQPGSSQYRRLIAAFQRIFGATIFFGTDAQKQKAEVVHRARFNFMTEARIWYSRDLAQKNLPGDCRNTIVRSDEFYREITGHPIPTDLEATKALSSCPAALDLYRWLSYRCFTAKGKERVPLFGEFGLVSQLGGANYARPRKFREKLEGWLHLVRAMWPDCPATIDRNGTGLYVDRAVAVLSSQSLTTKGSRGIACQTATRDRVHQFESELPPGNNVKRGVVPPVEATLQARPARHVLADEKPFHSFCSWRTWVSTPPLRRIFACADQRITGIAPTAMRTGNSTTMGLWRGDLAR